ncbi:MAG: hypothetical protein Q8K64_07630 [Sediminibacterium sp.]|nr:hypothetical protein [Sediminibacterium sp.]
MQKAWQKILLFCPFLGTSFTLIYFGHFESLTGYAASFISVSLAIATFAITFSFTQYTFSPYKSLLRAVSIRQLLFSLLLVFIAMVPLITLLIQPSYVCHSAIVCIPLLLYATILLMVIAREESDPYVYLRRSISQKSIGKYLSAFGKAAEIATKDKKRLSFHNRGEAPMHDYESSGHPFFVRNDPFDRICEVISLSLTNNDSIVFESSIDAYFNAVDKCRAFMSDQDNDQRFKLQQTITHGLKRICQSVVTQSSNTLTQNMVIEKLSHFLKEKAIEHAHTNHPFFDFAEVLTDYGCKIFEQENRTGVLMVCALMRELSQKGIADKHEDDSRKIDHYLSGFARHIRTVGDKAIEKLNSDILYRCLEELGFLGCTAIKANQYHVSIECIQSLTQLGRAARAAKMKCFYPSCLLEPVDHAEQRIWWMLSWVPYLDQKQRERWAETFSTAYSRLNGFTINISEQLIDGKIGFSFERTKEAYTMSYSEGGYYRTIDYSDFTDLKEFRLY